MWSIVERRASMQPNCSRPPTGADRLVVAARVPDRTRSRAGDFRILDYVQATRREGRSFIARCPSCAQGGHDRSGDNLSISVEEPLKYKCWAGCTKEMIRAALGRPIPERRSA
jgi:hypothetical protein